MTRRCYAVLAKVSLSYSPLQGRLVTCYSPVRHFTQDRSPFLVRLACVRHAASVDSEPGSNSRLKPVVYVSGRRSEIVDRASVSICLATARQCTLPCEIDQAKLDRLSRLARSTLLSKILESGPPERCPSDRGPNCNAWVSPNLLRWLSLAAFRCHRPFCATFLDYRTFNLLSTFRFSLSSRSEAAQTRC